MKWFALVASLALVQACAASPETETVAVALRPGQVFEHPTTVGGDEEGARIVVQPRHAAISEIRRNAQTGWIAVYVYQAADNYVGADDATIEVSAGSDGASAPWRVTRITFLFTVRE